MSRESEDTQDVTEIEEDALESWEDGPAFGVSEDKDPVCEDPVAVSYTHLTLPTICSV